MKILLLEEERNGNTVGIRMGFFTERRPTYFSDKTNIYWYSFWHHEADREGFLFQISYQTSRRCQICSIKALLSQGQRWFLTIFMVGAEGIQEPIKPSIDPQGQPCLWHEWPQSSTELVFSHRRCYTKNVTAAGDESPCCHSSGFSSGKALVPFTGISANKWVKEEKQFYFLSQKILKPTSQGDLDFNCFPYWKPSLK